MTCAVLNPLIVQPASAPQGRITLAGPGKAANCYRNHSIPQKAHYKKQCLKVEDANVCLDFSSIRGDATAKFRRTSLVSTACKAPKSEEPQFLNQ